MKAVDAFRKEKVAFSGLPKVICILGNVTVKVPRFCLTLYRPVSNFQIAV
jgi:hypothetical protein